MKSWEPSFWFWECLESLFFPWILNASHSPWNRLKSSYLQPQGSFCCALRWTGLSPPDRFFDAFPPKSLPCCWEGSKAFEITHRGLFHYYYPKFCEYILKPSAAWFYISIIEFAISNIIIHPRIPYIRNCSYEGDWSTWDNPSLATVSQFLNQKKRFYYIPSSSLNTDFLLSPFMHLIAFKFRCF